MSETFVAIDQREGKTFSTNRSENSSSTASTRMLDEVFPIEVKLLAVSSEPSMEKYWLSKAGPAYERVTYV